jgi:hypothetical protein|tara:strand:- start:85 stop:858 length:774 start_codon:yes stop_codon:yes gene_type:complete
MKFILKIAILIITSSINAQEVESFDINSININNWKNTPHVKGRLTTKTDVEKNRAIYASDGTRKNISVNLEIPFLACIIDARTERKDTVVVIQVDKINGKIFTGYRTFHGGGYGTALLEHFDMIIGYEKNLNIASELYLGKEEIPKSILKKLVPENNSEFGMYYGTTGPDHKLGKTDFFYGTTRLIFEQVTSENNSDFYLPSLNLASFSDGEYAEEFIEYLELIINTDKEKFCKSLSGIKYKNHNPIKYYSELNKCE